MFYLLESPLSNIFVANREEWEVQFTLTTYIWVLDNGWFVIFGKAVPPNARRHLPQDISLCIFFFNPKYPVYHIMILETKRYLQRSFLSEQEANKP